MLTLKTPHGALSRKQHKSVDMAPEGQQVKRSKIISLIAASKYDGTVPSLNSLFVVFVAGECDGET